MSTANTDAPRLEPCGRDTPRVDWPTVRQLLGE